MTVFLRAIFGSVACVVLLASCAGGHSTFTSSDDPDNRGVDVIAVDQFTYGGAKSSEWRDATGASPTHDALELAYKKCEKEIIDSSTDQIHIVPYDKVEACLVSKGWKKIAMK
jgi:hypothetical protein